jgi:large subunit ribosomal protein L5
MEQYVPRLKKEYKDRIAAELKEEFGYSTPMQIPRIEKVSVSAGVGEAITNKNLLESAVKELAMITGQQPVKTKARKSISNFKLREDRCKGNAPRGQNVGVSRSAYEYRPAAC